MSKSHTLIITLSCEDDRKEVLSKAMQDITMNAVNRAIQSNLNIDKLASTPGPNMSTTITYRNGHVFDECTTPVIDALYNKEIKTGTVEAEDIAVEEATQMTEEEARKSLMDSIERSLKAPSLESHK